MKLEPLDTDEWKDIHGNIYNRTEHGFKKIYAEIAKLTWGEGTEAAEKEWIQKKIKSNFDDMKDLAKRARELGLYVYIKIETDSYGDGELYDDFQSSLRIKDL